jgi:fibronectin type 3 domain-containing protein
MTKYSANKYWIDILWQQRNMSLVPAPSGFTGQLDGDTISLSWNAVAGATYNVYRGTTSGGETLLMSGVNSTSYDDNAINIAESTTYYYQVTAVLDSHESVKSSEISLITIVTTTDLLATPVGSTIVLTWSVAPGASGYVLGRGVDPGSLEELTTTVDNTYTDSDVGADVTYYYELYGLNDNGFSVISNETSASI